MGGSGNSFKSISLRERFGTDAVESPTVPTDPIETEKIIDKIVQENKEFPLVFVGSSLGGFWANYFGQKYDAPCILVNPAPTPSIALKKYGVPQSEIDGYIPLEKKLYFRNTNGALINVFLAKDDDIVNFKESIDAYPYLRFIKMFPDGGHRLKEHWPDVMDRVAELLDGKR